MTGLSVAENKILNAAAKNKRNRRVNKKAIASSIVRAAKRLGGSGSMGELSPFGYIESPSQIKARGWRRWASYIPRAIGAGASHLLGGSAGTGWDMGRRFSQNVLGWGDYSVPWKGKMNSLVSAGNVPEVHGVSESGVRLCHKEFIGQLYSSTAFTNHEFVINPGIDDTFPWLSSIAANFQEYRLDGMVISFKSELTNAVATFSSLGSVIIATDLNPAAPAAASQVAMEQMQFVASAKPNESIVAPIECAPQFGGHDVRFIRTGSVPASASICDYDHGKLQVATVGQPSDGVALGRLYVSYDITLLNPKLTNVAYQNTAIYGLTAPAAAPRWALPVPSFTIKLVSRLRIQQLPYQHRLAGITPCSG